jgi:hypothetical protein
MSSNSRSLYQAQLQHQHLYTISKQQLLAKYWIESILNIKLPNNDLHDCLKDGLILCKSVQYKQWSFELPYLNNLVFLL